MRPVSGPGMNGDCNRNDNFLLEIGEALAGGGGKPGGVMEKITRASTEPMFVIRWGTPLGIRMLSPVRRRNTWSPHSNFTVPFRTTVTSSAL